MKYINRQNNFNLMNLNEEKTKVYLILGNMDKSIEDLM